MPNKSISGKRQQILSEIDTVTSSEEFRFDTLMMQKNEKHTIYTLSHCLKGWFDH